MNYSTHNIKPKYGITRKTVNRYNFPILFTIIRAGFNLERPGLSARVLDKTETESRDFMDTFASQKTTETLCFSYPKK